VSDSDQDGLEGGAYIAVPRDLQRRFGGRVKALRQEQKLTQRKLAAIAGYHWTYLGQVERGERNVTLTTIVRIGAALGIDAAELLRGLATSPRK